MYVRLKHTVLSLFSSTINRSSLLTSDALLPPNSTALLSSTEVKVNWKHGGGSCPVMYGGLHSPGGNDIKW